MQKGESVRNKIIILYILSRIPGMTVGELTSVALDTYYMNYFEFASAFDNLLTSGFITTKVRKNEQVKDADGRAVLRCDTTGLGVESLNRLQHLIPDNIHTFLNKTSKDWEKSIKKNAEVKANYDPDFFGGYTVTLSLSDGNKDLINLKISVPSKEIAVVICNDWKQNTQSQYLAILSILSGNK